MIASFSLVEKIIFYTLSSVFIVSTLWSLIALNERFLVRVPAQGGSLSEGVIGAPRLINPLLALSDADRDLTNLIYSGLMRATPNGDLMPDLAESYEVSDDGLVYTFTLKEGLVFHDGKPLSSDDVIFTIDKVQDSLVKSTKRASWEGVIAEKINDRTLTFTLSRPYTPFLENTTIGILPKHIWGAENVTSEEFVHLKFNTEPIGSGPYRIKSISKDSSGIPRYYDLVAFRHFSLGRPHITTIRLSFYANEDELIGSFEDGEIDAINAISSHHIEALTLEERTIMTYTLPRVFGVFFNQNHNTLFTNFSVRSALEAAIDREEIIEEVLLGYGTAIHGPLPPGSFATLPIAEVTEESNDLHETTTDETSSPPLDIVTTGEVIDTHYNEAVAILEEAGWKLDEETGLRTRTSRKGSETLQFSLATSDANELVATTERVKARWESLGARVDLKIFSTSDLNRNIIRPRQYDALFFGEIIGRELDPFAFWHSSQRNDPGLNIALYANITADRLLEDGRVTKDRDERAKIYQQFQAEVAKDIPAVFMYSPDFIYITPTKVQGITAGTITIPSERFLDVHDWYIETERLWKVFTNDNDTIN